MPSGYAVDRTDADSPGGGFLVPGFAVCMEGEEDEAAVHCGPGVIPNLSVLSPKQVQPLYYGRTHIERGDPWRAQARVLACMKSILL